MAEGSAPRRLLVVEDELLVAAAIEDVIRSLGLGIVGPAARAGDALRLLEDDGPVDGAVIDIKLRHGETAYPVAARLRRQGVPFLFVTAYTRGSVDPPFSTERILSKPFSADVLRRVIHAMLDVPPRD